MADGFQTKEQDRDMADKFMDVFVASTPVAKRMSLEAWCVVIEGLIVCVIGQSVM
jgi:hypothetical protein